MENRNRTDNLCSGQKLASDCSDFVFIVFSPTGLGLTAHEGLVGLIVIHLCTIVLGLEISPDILTDLYLVSLCKYFGE